MAPDVSLAAMPQRRPFAHFPWHLAVIVLSISAIGIWNLASASRSAHAPVWISQTVWMGAGMVIALAVTLFDPRGFQRLAWVFYAIVLVLLVAVMVKGRYVMGARRWLAVGPVNFQPSELAKLSVALALASWFHADAEKRKDGYGLFGLAIPLAVTALPAALILKQPDLGTALIVLAVGGTQILFAKVRWKTLALLVGVGAAGAVLVYPHLKPYQKKRVETFLNPQADALGAGYHATQSMIAVGSGQGLGKGWGQGTQTYLSFLPEQHTDFIFPVVGEELGFLGVTVALALFLLLLLRSVRIASRSADPFPSLVAFGLAAAWFVHILVNIGMTLNLMPVTGIPLPFFSYGGSFMLMCWLSVGILGRISREGRGPADMFVI